MNLDGRGTPSWGDVWQWKFGLGPGEDPALSDPRARAPAAVEEPNLMRIGRPDPAVLQLTWIGHATWLIQIGGFSLLTDPIFSEDCSPFPVPRIRRAVPAALRPAGLPPIDAVLISHTHYDHCDTASLRGLRNVRACVVPLGVGPIVAPAIQGAVLEAGWGEKLEAAVTGRTLSLTCVPAQHGSARTAWDRNTTLWCGWLIEVDGRRIYFAGDTADSALFDEFGSWLGEVDVALIPIGTYRPRWFMNRVHCDPAQAVRIHKAVGARRSLAMHWGVFPLADEPPGEPPLLLAEAAVSAGLAPGEFTAPAIGQTVIL